MNVGEDAEKLETSYFAGRTAEWHVATVGTV